LKSLTDSNRPQQELGRKTGDNALLTVQFRGSGAAQSCMTPSALPLKYALPLPTITKVAFSSNAIENIIDKVDRPTEQDAPCDHPDSSDLEPQDGTDAIIAEVNALAPSLCDVMRNVA
jgi:hypothetical protein